jgi:hypothetical protein
LAALSVTVMMDILGLLMFIAWILHFH